MPMDRRRVTLKDIAIRTGYSVNTVSRALRDTHELSEATKEEIRRVANEMGYVLNRSANALRSGLSHTLALIVADITNPLFAIIAKEIEGAAEAEGYTVIMMNTEEDEGREERAIRAAIEKNADGVLLFQTQLNRHATDKLTAFGIPCVLIHRTFEDQKLDAVCVDERMGGYLAGKRLVAGGRRHIVMLNAPTHISSSRMRQEGFEQAMREAGPGVRFSVTFLKSALGGCREVIPALFGGEDDPDGLFCFSDMLAFEAISCLSERGYAVPKDVSVIGFDNIQSKLCIPFPLTTISVHKSELARRAITLILRRVRGDYGDFPLVTTQPVSLMERGSV